MAVIPFVSSSRALDRGWVLVESAAGTAVRPADLPAHAERLPATVPSTVAATLAGAGTPAKPPSGALGIESPGAGTFALTA